MHRRQPLPRLWLMTDERQGEGLWDALARLPHGTGIVFRHYSLPDRERRKIFERIRREARKRGFLVILAGPPGIARQWRADGSHGRSGQRPQRGLVRTTSAHDLPEIKKAERAGVDLIFLSPAFATRSHPGQRALGRKRFMLLARQARVPVIALGGMDSGRARRLGGAIYGWAGIDAWK